MAKVNLRDLYPEYKRNCFIEVPDGDADAFISALTKAIADVYVDGQRAEAAYLRRLFWNRAHYSLDVGDDIEREAVFISQSPCEIYERKLTMECLYSAIHSLPEAQGRRIYAHFILGVPRKAIARAEGMCERTISASIERGLKNLEKILKKIL